ncbi:hypothetical protein BMS3Abin03_01789 [bacterium BMS3Abin03]|nr:hypothetical protein BMS3Abin03_01789 [bacterium BMS3Abin03]
MQVLEEAKVNISKVYSYKAKMKRLLQRQHV